MCGIAGLSVRLPGLADRDWAERALRELRHRGPDDGGLLSVAGDTLCNAAEIERQPRQARLWLAHRRLSILDLSPAGRQPLCTPDRRYWIVFNGEIYNYLELRDELTACGHRFQTETDTEVLLAAYVQWGTAALLKLVGMFALAIYDHRENSLFLARDGFGVKPLYYRRTPELFAFASELDVLLDRTPGARRVNPRRLAEYLCHSLTDHGGETLFNEIRQLPAAHFLMVDLDRPGDAVPQRYWRLEIDRPLEISFDDAAARLRELFLDSVRLHLRSDVPVGAALSGGIDSSSIVMAIRQVQPRPLDLHVFSYVADDAALSEERWIDLVAREARATVHKVRLTPEEGFGDLSQLVDSQAEPFGSTSLLAQRRVFQTARKQGVQVMLDGQGADELLAGYPACLSARLAGLVQAGRLGTAADLLRGTAAIGLPRRSLVCGLANHLLPHAVQRVLRRAMNRGRFPPGVNGRWFADRGVRPSLPFTSGGSSPLRRYLRELIERQSLPQLLRYEDRNSMAFSIESRVPFLTPQLASFVLSLPEDYLVAADGTTKSVFRAAMRGIVPDAILDRRDKIGFATPQRQWLLERNRQVTSLLQSEAMRQVPALDLNAMRRLWREIVAGRRLADAAFFRCLNLLEWSERFGVEYDASASEFSAVSSAAAA